VTAEILHRSILRLGGSIDAQELQQELTGPGIIVTVSYTHLTLPTKA
jgi:hypothetical protein